MAREARRMYRLRIIPLTALVIFLLYLSHRHLGQLGEVLRTYTTFYPYIARHPETLYRYESSSTNTSLLPGETTLIPRIIHRIYLNEHADNTSASASTVNLSSPALTSCQSLHPNWTQRIWTNLEATAFISSQYPDLERTYTSYRQTIQRANVLRYALLHHFGGIYLDLDITCLRPLDILRTLPWLTPAAFPAGVNNAFILAQPQHPFLEFVLANVARENLNWGLPYASNMLSTGCQFLSNKWIQYVNRLEQDGKWEDKLFVLADEQGDVRGHMLRGKVTTPLFVHGGLSSWHSWDAGVMLFLGRHWIGAFGIGVMLVAFGLRSQWRGFRGRRVKVRKGHDVELEALHEGRFPA